MHPHKGNDVKTAVSKSKRVFTLLVSGSKDSEAAFVTVHWMKEDILGWEEERKVQVDLWCGHNILYFGWLYFLQAKLSSTDIKRLFECWIRIPLQTSLFSAPKGHMPETFISVHELPSPMFQGGFRKNEREVFSSYPCGTCSRAHRDTVAQWLSLTKAHKSHPSAPIPRLVSELLINSQWFPCAWNHHKHALLELLLSLTCRHSVS